MAKKKIDPQVQRMMESFNRKPTAAEETDFYRRNAGGPMVMTSLTRGNGVLGTVPYAHVMAYHSHQLAEENKHKLAEELRTYHEAHIVAWRKAVYWPERQMQHQNTQHAYHCVTRFYHLHPHHRPAWMLNPFLLDP
jgi:hypothetical protein